MKYLIIQATLLVSFAYGQENKSISISEDSLDNISKCYIVAGSGGGFTGQVIKFYLTDKGNIYRSNSQANSLGYVKNISRKDTKKIIRKLKALHLEKLNFNHPGNMSYFLEQHRNGKVHTVTWGDPSQKAPAEVIAFYNMLKDKIKDAP